MMPVAFQQAITSGSLWGGNSPSQSPVITPKSVGDMMMLIIACEGGTGVSFTLQSNNNTGSPFYTQNSFNDTSSISWGELITQSCAGGPQVLTLTDSIGNYDATYLMLEYSGIANITNSSVLQVTNPGTGVGAIQGTSVTVPANSVLVAACIDPNYIDTITSPSGTQRAQFIFNPSTCAVDYQGTGAAIKPTFTTSNANTINYYVIWQYILNPQTSKPIKYYANGQFFANTFNEQNSPGANLAMKMYANGNVQTHLLVEHSGPIKTYANGTISANVFSEIM
jgi:hypothetical protein